MTPERREELQRRLERLKELDRLILHAQQLFAPFDLYERAILTREVMGLREIGRRFAVPMTAQLQVAMRLTPRNSSEQYLQAQLIELLTRIVMFEADAYPVM